MSVPLIENALAGIEAGANALWVGASAGFAFVSAPVAFHAIPQLDVFATVTERTLDRLATMTTVASGVAIACAVTRALLEPDGRTNGLARAAAGGGAIALVAYQQRAIVPAMAQMQRAMGSFEGIAENDPRRVAYDAMHDRSTRVYGSALLLGFTSIVLGALRSSAPSRAGSQREPQPHAD